jgi:hypothetical protein
VSPSPPIRLSGGSLNHYAVWLQVLLAAKRVPKDAYVGVGTTGDVYLDSGAPFAFMLYGKPREVTRPLESKMAGWTATTVIIQVGQAWLPSIPVVFVLRGTPSFVLGLIPTVPGLMVKS